MYVLYNKYIRGEEMIFLEIYLAVMAFMIGALFGSFFSLALYRIPLKQDITHKNSYCPVCKHNLGFFDLIPVFSYLFAGGKCKYCKCKISPRYIILEVTNGLVFLAVYFILRSIMGIDIKVLFSLLLFAIVYAVIFVLVGVRYGKKK